MSNPVSFYAIRIKGTDFFKISKHNWFGSFEQAMENGVFFNTYKNAEKVIKEKTKSLKGHPDYQISQSRYEITVDGKSKYYTAIKEFANSATHYDIEFRDIDLEVVELHMIISGGSPHCQN